MNLRSNISQRTSADVTIVRQGQSNLVVPITPRSTRRFMLMQEDYIQLEFSLPSAQRISIGNYINDTIFGKFVVTEEQMPRYNQQTGGYDYSLKFNAEYMGWKNKIHCLVAGGERTDCEWGLTDRLAVHAQQIADDVNAIFGYTTPQPSYEGEIVPSTKYIVKVSAANASDVHYIGYRGVDIITALNAIAEKWECEWWVTEDTTGEVIDGVRYKRFIHFGKCEDSGSAYTMALGDNVESMDVQRDQQTYATRIFGYGGTQNVPETYDRQLIFSVTDNDTNGFKDGNRPLSHDMIMGESSATRVPIAMNNAATASGNTYSQTSQHVTLTNRQTLEGNVSANMVLSAEWGSLDNIPSVSARLILHVGNDTQVLDESGIITPSEDMSSAMGDAMVWIYGYAISKDLNLVGNTEVWLEVVWSLLFNVVVDITSAAFDGTLSSAMAVSGEATGTKQVKVTPYGSTNEYPATYYGENGYIRFNDAVPPRWREGSQYTLSPMSIKVPISYYTRDYSVNGMSAVGERRIHLEGNRYRDAQGASAIVEAVVVWEDEYPRLDLRIKAGTIYKTTKTDTIEHSDGSVSREDWTQYSFQAEYNDGETWQDYVFNIDWLMDGCKLQAVFSAPATAQSSGWMLGGMTFDVGYNRMTKRFTVIRNEDFGASLPNDYIKPSDEDEFILVGWNPNAMNEMGLIAASQTRLESKVNEYLQALQEGQFTFSCRMMSRTMMYYPFVTNPATDGNGLRKYGLLNAGCKVTINHDALPGGSKTSRVIGYEYKLDMPYDTPTYTIGETEAFSRLKKIEKQLTKL